MDFHNITQKKYLQYFNSNKEYSLSDNEMKEFLNDMITLCEIDPPEQSPTEILLNIKDRLECNDNLIHCIHRIVKSDLYLTEIELFSLLWYVSCKNSLSYENSIYLQFANEGVIGQLIKRLLCMSHNNYHQFLRPLKTYVLCKKDFQKDNTHRGR